MFQYHFLKIILAPTAFKLNMPRGPHSLFPFPFVQNALKYSILIFIVIFTAIENEVYSLIEQISSNCERLEIMVNKEPPNRKQNAKLWVIILLILQQTDIWIHIYVIDSLKLWNSFSQSEISQAGFIWLFMVLLWGNWWMWKFLVSLFNFSRCVRRLSTLSRGAGLVLTHPPPTHASETVRKHTSKVCSAQQNKS